VRRSRLSGKALADRKGAGMNRLGLMLVPLLVSSGPSGCGGPEQKPPAEVGDSTIRMGNDTLFKSGSSWVFQFDAGAVPCFVVGDHVSFASREHDHLVVKLDAHMTVDIPTHGEHRILLVDPDGFSEVEIDPDRFSTPQDLLRAVVAAKKGSQ